MIDVGLVIVAAGRGERLGASTEKARVPIFERPMLAWSLLVFDTFPEITERVVVVPPGRESVFQEQILDPLELEHGPTLVAGGLERQDSVRNGLQALGDGPERVLVHDAARPLVSPLLVRRILDALEAKESVVPALPPRDSMARVGSDTGIETYVDRTELLAVQTPQGFHRPVLSYAFEKADQDRFTGTDEASLVLRIHHPVSWIEGEVENMKITYPADLVQAEAVFRMRRADR